MVLDRLKYLLPDRPIPMRIWFGPFRGARIVMKPRNSLRKLFGLYEHELNMWLRRAIPRVTRVLDVGANDGYFTFGCAAAFRRLGKAGQIISFEPLPEHVQTLRESTAAQPRSNTRIEIIQALVGPEVRDGMISLDALPVAVRQHTLVKIDVEGAEIDVVEGARTWLDPSNLFLIEVHQERFLNKLRKRFAGWGQTLVQINQRPLLILGRERRDEQNWWLVSDLEPER
jgi:hypothetical protein